MPLVCGGLPTATPQGKTQIPVNERFKPEII
jgi:hypothetical protein